MVDALKETKTSSVVLHLFDNLMSIGVSKNVANDISTVFLSFENSLQKHGLILAYLRQDIVTLNTKIDTVENNLNIKISALDSKFDEKFNTLNTKIDNVENNLSIKISALDSKFDEKFNTLNSKIDNNFNLLDSKFDEKFNTLNSKIDNNFNLLDSKIDNNFNLLNAKIDALDSKVDNNFNLLDSKFDEKFNTVNIKIDSLQDSMKVIKGIGISLAIGITLIIIKQFIG